MNQAFLLTVQLDPGDSPAGLVGAIQDACSEHGLDIVSCTPWGQSQQPTSDWGAEQGPNTSSPPTLDAPMAPQVPEGW